MARKRRRLSWQFKLPTLLVIFATAPLAVMAFWMFDLLEETFESATIDSLEALARAKAEAIEQFTEDRTAEVERIAQLVAPRVTRVEETGAELERRTPEEQERRELPELQDAEALPTPEEAERVEDSGEAAEEVEAIEPADPPPPVGANGPAAAHEDALRELRQQLGLILWDQQKFEELLVIAADGRVLASTFSEHEGKTAEELAYFQNGRGATFVQPVFMSPITERLTMVISTPIRDEDAQVVGVLAARLNLSRFFRLINDTAGLGETGETVVGKLIDEEILFMAPTRHDPTAALERKVPFGSLEGLPLQNAARGERGGGRVVDYRAECTYAAWEHVPSLEWALAVKIDCAEAVAPVHEARMRMLLLAIGIIALALISAFIAAGTLVRPLRELKNAADRISKGDFNVQLRIRAGDEIGDLADSFERMVAAIKFFREHSRSEEEEAQAEAEAIAAAEARASAEEDPSKDGEGQPSD